MRSAAILFFTAVSSMLAGPPPDLGPLKKWLARQEDIRTVAADFTQTRTLRVLRDPVATPGRLWFAVPGSVRWEIGSPAKTIVLRKAEKTTIITPAKRRAERQSGGSSNGAMAMLRFPLAKDFADFQRQFEVLAITPSAERCRVEVVPRDAQARKFITSMTIDFSQTNGHLLAFEMKTRDGSAMRQEFSNVRTNTKIPAGTFDYDLTGFEVTDAKE